MRILKSKNTIFALLAAAIILVPSSLALAQTPTPTPTVAQSSGDVLTWQELENMTRLETELNAIKNTDPSYSSKYGETKNACAAIGVKLKAVSQNTWGSEFVGSGIAQCKYGFVDAAAFRLGIARVDSNQKVDDYITGIKTSKSTLDETKYETVKTQITESSANNSWLEDLLNVIVTTLANIIASIFAGVATLALSLMSLIIDYTTGAAANLRPDIIDKTWYVIRDIMNLMFILALIVMALGTILQSKQYNRSLLGKLILMALLINFSKVIAETLISVSDTLIVLFKPQGTLLSYARQIFAAFVTNGDGLSGFIGLNGQSVGQALGSSITKLIGLFVLTVAVCAFAGLMLVRMIGLWFLVMTSPIAYGLNILPSTSKAARQWWQYLIKYLVWGPVAMFFFRVGFILINDVGLNLVKDSSLNPIIMGAFFYAGFIVAKGSGMAGAGLVTSYADKALSKGKSWMSNSAAFGAGAAQNYFVRGKAARHAVAIGTLGNASKEFKDKVQDKTAKATAWVGNKPKQIMEKYVDKPNTERKKLVDKQYRRMQLKNIYDKNITEDIAKKISPEDVHYLATSGKLNEDKIKAISENGSRDAVDSLLLALKDGQLEVGGKAGIKDEFEYRSVVNAIGAAKWKSVGGREYEMPQQYIDELKDKIEIKPTRGFNDAEKKIIEDARNAKDATKEDIEKAELLAKQKRQEWANDPKNGFKERKASIPTEYIRKEIRKARAEQGEGKEQKEAAEAAKKAAESQTEASEAQKAAAEAERQAAEATKRAQEQMRNSQRPPDTRAQNTSDRNPPPVL